MLGVLLCLFVRFGIRVFAQSLLCAILLYSAVCVYVCSVLLYGDIVVCLVRLCLFADLRVCVCCYSLCFVLLCCMFSCICVSFCWLNIGVL